MKMKYTADELNDLLDNKKHFLILIRDKNDNFHYVSSKPNWLCDAELLTKATELVAQRLNESQN